MLKPIINLMGNTCLVVVIDGEAYFSERGNLKDLYKVATTFSIPPSAKKKSFLINATIIRLISEESRVYLRINSLEDLPTNIGQTTTFGKYDSISFDDIPPEVMTWLVHRSSPKYSVPFKINSKLTSHSSYPAFNNTNSDRIQEEIVDVQPKKAYNKSVKVPFEELRFVNGAILFDYNSDPLLGKREVRVSNNFVISEFDSIKGYFGKALGKKKVEVFLEFFNTPDMGTTITAKSEDLDQITPLLIDRVRENVLDARIKQTSDPTQQTELLSFDDLLETFEEGEISTKTLFKDEDELFDTILKIKEPKHKEYLEFLWKEHELILTKLRYLFKPFSFVFLLKGRLGFYVVWETLDTSEATYLWNIGDNLSLIDSGMEEIESVIGIINKRGKTEYLRDAPSSFSRIRHNYLDEKSGFQNWKDDLTNVLEGIKRH